MNFKRFAGLPEDQQPIAGDVSFDRIRKAVVNQWIPDTSTQRPCEPTHNDQFPTTKIDNVWDWIEVPEDNTAHLVPHVGHITLSICWCGTESRKLSDGRLLILHRG